MPQAFSIALTGLKAFDRKLDVNANNIANVNTDNFKKSRVELQETANGGVEVTISKVETPGVELDSNPRTGDPQQQSNVNVAEEFVDQIVTHYAYDANILAVKTAEEMQKTLLDIKT